jgi:hypothetical protein
VGPGDVVTRGAPDGDGVLFKVLGAAEVVGFAVPLDWHISGLQSLPPVAVAAFQLPDKGDDNPSDSTHFSLSIYHIDDDDGRAATAVVGKQYGDDPPKRDHYKGWTSWSSEGAQNGVSYTLLDLAQTFDALKIEVAVRCAWPHLASHVATFDGYMVEACHGLADSVTARGGAYTLAADDLVHHPSLPPADAAKTDTPSADTTAPTGAPAADTPPPDAGAPKLDEPASATPGGEPPKSDAPKSDAPAGSTPDSILDSSPKPADPPAPDAGSATSPK